MKNFENANMEPVKIANGRFVAYGHEVENFGLTAVVVGYRAECGSLYVKETKNGAIVPGSQWLANPKFCK